VIVNELKNTSRSMPAARRDETAIARSATARRRTSRGAGDARQVVLDDRLVVRLLADWRLNRATRPGAISSPIVNFGKPSSGPISRMSMPVSLSMAR